MRIPLRHLGDLATAVPYSGPADYHLFQTEHGHHMLAVNGSRVYSVPPELAGLLNAPGALSSDLLAAHGLTAPPYVDDEPLHDPPLRAISLAIAQACNLGCSYCYAQQGSFGGEAKAMGRREALAAIDLLFAGAETGSRVQVTYLGGEPLANRTLLHESADYASALGMGRGIDVRFSITTNGTLLTPEDGEFFERLGFAVTISIDGIGDAHDRLRPFKDGRGSYDRVILGARPLLARQRRMQVSARVTVTPANLDLVGTLDALLAMGFHSVGFSPMLSSPDGREEMGASALDSMLQQMVACGREFERRVSRGERYPFLNLVTALREIHKGTHRPYPCGAGAGYLGVSAEGTLHACHRFVGDDEAQLGDVVTGIHREKQNRWLADRHVHVQEPCRRCWARYLCGGGCHHEVIHRGRPACDFIRGWLEYALQSYIRLLDARPDYFAA